MADFVNQLRQNNVFAPPDENSWNPDEARGMINMIYPLIKQAKDDDMRRQITLHHAMQPQQPPQDVGSSIHKSIWGANSPLSEIAKQSAVGGNGTGNFQLAPGAMTDYQKAQIDLQKQSLGQKGEVAGAKDENADEDRAIKQQRADTYTSMHDLTDAEKFDLINRARRGDIEARGIIQRDLLETRGTQATDQIEARGKNAEELAGTNNTNRLAQIAATAAEQRATNAAKPTTGSNSANLPTQQRVDQNNKARQLANQYPDLAKWIKFESNGNFSVSPDADEVSKANIGRILYGSQTKPAETTAVKPVTQSAAPNKTPTTTTPRATTSTANDPLGIR